MMLGRALRKGLYYGWFTLFAVVALGAVEDNKNYKRYDSPDGRFSVALPVDWIYSVPTDGTVVQGTRPNTSSDAMAEYVMIGSIEIGDHITLSQFVQVTMDGFKQLNPAVNIVSQESMKIDGNDAVKVVYTSRAREKAFKSSQIFIVKKGRGFYIAGMALLDAFDKYVQTFDEIAMSFRFRN